MSSVTELKFGLKSKGKAVQKEQSKKSSLKPSKLTGGKPLSLSQLMKQLPTKQNYKGYEIKVMFLANVRGRSGWIAAAKKDNVVVVGVDAKGAICIFPEDVGAMQHICSLVDIDQENSSFEMNVSTILEAFNE